MLLGGTLLFGVVACGNAKTSADAPSDMNGEVTDPANADNTLGDGSSKIRQDQLNSDIRAREQRNDLGGDQTKRADSDLESEVRAKLEANIPRGKLTVAAKDGAVTIVGTVPDEKEYKTVEPLAKEILGVTSVKVDVEIVPGEKL